MDNRSWLSIETKHSVLRGTRVGFGAESTTAPGRSAARSATAAVLRDRGLGSRPAARRQDLDHGLHVEGHAVERQGCAPTVHVQQRMRENAAELWRWLEEGAHFYVCGDAKRMAKDVERALVDIVAQCGARSTDEAVLFVSELKKKGRFQQDVY